MEKLRQLGFGKIEKLEIKIDTLQNIIFDFSSILKAFY